MQQLNTVQATSTKLKVFIGTAFLLAGVSVVAVFFVQRTSVQRTPSNPPTVQTNPPLLLRAIAFGRRIVQHTRVQNQFDQGSTLELYANNVKLATYNFSGNTLAVNGSIPSDAALMIKTFPRTDPNQENDHSVQYAEMLWFQYEQGSQPGRGQEINICVGATQAPWLYVGSDGSTYTDAAMTQRTTAQSCQMIRSRALVFSSVTGGTTTRTPDTLDYGIARSYAELAHMYIPDYTFVVGTQGTSPNNKEPLHIEGFSSLHSPPGHRDGDRVIAPTYYLTLEGYDGQNSPLSKRLCVPQVSFKYEVLSPFLDVWYYDVNGQPYDDPLLQTPDQCPPQKSDPVEVSP